MGTQKFPFTRLFKEIDKLIETNFITEEVIAQTGYEKIKTNNFKTVQLISESEFENLVNKSSLVITHAGTSSIIKSLSYGKKVVVVPRMKKFNEHVDNHQVEITKIYSLKEYIEPVYEIENLKNAISLAKLKSYNKYTFQNENALVESIIKYLKELGER